MTTKIIFCVFLLIFSIEIHYINALDCYSCLSIGQNITDCHDPLNTNGTSIQSIKVTTSDALCTKITGKLSNNIKFTLRNGSLNGCPRGMNSTDIVGNRTDIQTAYFKIHCCNKNFCNQANHQYYTQWYFLLLTTITIYLFI